MLHPMFIRNKKNIHICCCAILQNRNDSHKYIKERKNSKIIHAKTGTCCLEAAFRSGYVESDLKIIGLIFFSPKSFVWFFSIFSINSIYFFDNCLIINCTIWKMYILRKTNNIDCFWYKLTTPVKHPIILFKYLVRNRAQNF